uniref:Mediator complex subunit 11 n=1 Tax=Panagrellus redivivus TaxID=6233 RepID=A0A7E4V3V3_PANRE
MAEKTKKALAKIYVCELEELADKMQKLIVSSVDIKFRNYTVSEVKICPDNFLQHLHDVRQCAAHLGACIKDFKSLSRRLKFDKNPAYYDRYMEYLYDVEHQFRDCNVRIKHLQEIKDFAMKP